MTRYLPLAIVLAAAGCGPAGPTPVPVAGRVTLDDKPVADMIVIFQPTGTTPGSGSMAKTDADGRFTLLDNSGAAGALAGAYKIYFYPAIADKPDDPAAVVARGGGGLPGIYLSPNQTPVSVTVPATGGTATVTLTKTGKGVSATVEPPAGG